MPIPTPFHPRTSELCTSLQWKEWAGYYAIRSFDVHFDREYYAFRHAAGMIDVTPDAVPVLGEDHRIKGLYLATGLSGHGFGIGPAIGRIMADLLADRDPGHDLSRFRLTRFSDGSEIVPGPY